jgi:hypothetical protein
MVLMSLLIGIIAGIYPAFSSPSSHFVLKGSFKPEGMALV